MQKLFYYLTALSVALLLCVETSAAAGELGPELVVNGEPVTPDEVLFLDPVCKLIMIEKPRAHLGERQVQNAALFEQPQYNMAKGAEQLHHRCWAIVMKQKYFKARTAEKRRYYLSRFYGDMNFVLTHAEPNWKYLPLMHVEIGETMILERRHAEALAEANIALKQDPGFARAFILIAQIQITLGHKDKALKAATEGLKNAPASKPLKRLYLESGGKEPFPEPYIKPAVTEPETDKEVTQTPILKEPSSEAHSTPTQVDTPTTYGTKTNPYCRFCTE